MNSDNKECYCSEHPKKIVSVVCLDEDCSHKRPFCILCINNHKKCNEKFIVKKKKLGDRVTINNAGEVKSQILGWIGSFFNKHVENLMTKLYKKKNFIVQSFDHDYTYNDLFDPDKLENIRKAFSVHIDSKSSKILLDSKLNSDMAYLEQELALLDKKLTKMIQRFLINDLSKLTFPVKDSFMVKDWITHINIQVKPQIQKNSLLFQRQGIDLSEDNFKAVLTNPLKGHRKFKLTIKSIYDGDRYLPFGLVTTKEAERLKGDLKSFRKSEYIFFCGYSQIGGLKGETPTDRHIDPKGLREGFECIME